MKKVILLSIIGIISITLSGCSGGDEPKPQQTPTANQDLSTDPSLNDQGFYRDQITDPALFDYNQKTNSGLSNPGEYSSDAGISKIGMSSPFDKYSKYNLSGIAQIISESKIRLTSFSYNGGCGPIKVGLALKTNIEKPLAYIKEISSPIENQTIELTIPSNISLIQFETIGIYCPDDPEPISEAEFD